MNQSDNKQSTWERPKKHRLLPAIMKGLSIMAITRGDIFYVCPQPTCGSEQRAGRPAVVVSNEKCNEKSSVVEVVFLTTRDKTPLPTHAQVTSAGRQSLALCEQITSVSVERFGDYIGHVTEEELRAINRALLISLDLPAGGLTVQADKQNEESLMAQVALRFVEDYLRRKSYSSEE